MSSCAQQKPQCDNNGPSGEPWTHWRKVEENNKSAVKLNSGAGGYLWVVFTNLNPDDKEWRFKPQYIIIIWVFKVLSEL